jgi:hypothetical protein
MLNTDSPFKDQWLYVPAPIAASELAFCIYGFYMILSVISEYLRKQHYPVELFNGEV